MLVGQLNVIAAFLLLQKMELGMEKPSLRFTEGVLAEPSVEVPDGSTARGGAPRPEINCGELSNFMRGPD